MDKCPKCGKKLTILNIKQECPSCGCDLLYYDIENRLEEDAKKAEAEFQQLASFLDKITPSFIKKRKNKNDEV